MRDVHNWLRKSELLTLKLYNYQNQAFKYLVSFVPFLVFFVVKKITTENTKKGTKYTKNYFTVSSLKWDTQFPIAPDNFCISMDRNNIFSAAHDTYPSFPCLSKQQEDHPW